jgi:hypothetical protein
MPAEVTGLRGVAWQLSYRTSTLCPDGRPLDILHEFYIPALQRSVSYDRVAGYLRSTSLAAASQLMDAHGTRSVYPIRRNARQSGDSRHE